MAALQDITEKSTPFEKVISLLLDKLKTEQAVELPEDAWHNRAIVYSCTTDYNTPLTSLSSDGISVEAIKLSKVSLFGSFCCRDSRSSLS